MKLPKTYTMVVTGGDLQKLEDAFRLAGYNRRMLPFSAASRHDGNYSIWGTSHTMARVMFEMLGLGIQNLAYGPANTMQKAWDVVDGTDKAVK